MCACASLVLQFIVGGLRVGESEFNLQRVAGRERDGRLIRKEKRGGEREREMDGASFLENAFF